MHLLDSVQLFMYTCLFLCSWTITSTSQMKQDTVRFSYCQMGQSYCNCPEPCSRNAAFHKVWENTALQHLNIKIIVQLFLGICLRFLVKCKLTKIMSTVYVCHSAQCGPTLRWNTGAVNFQRYHSHKCVEVVMLSFKVTNHMMTLLSLLPRFG